MFKQGQHFYVKNLVENFPCGKSGLMLIMLKTNILHSMPMEIFDLYINFVWSGTSTNFLMRKHIAPLLLKLFQSFTYKHLISRNKLRMILLFTFLQENVCVRLFKLLSFVKSFICLNECFFYNILPHKQTGMHIIHGYICNNKKTYTKNQTQINNFSIRNII